MSKSKKYEKNKRREKSCGIKKKLAKKIVGTIEGNPKGFAFLVREDGGDDLFIPASALHGAMHGDRVEAVMTSHNRGAGEAEVVAVVERGFSEIVGTYEAARSCGFVRPDNPRISGDVYIPVEASMGARSGQKVVCTIEDYPEGRNPVGRVDEIIGMLGEKGVDVLSVIRSYGLKEEFPATVMKEARALGDKIEEKDCEGRRDFRGDLVITIDGDDSKDFDDAVSLEKKKGGYRLYVHIADVANYVRANTKLDREAFKRGTSVYLCDRVIPMLPEQLSNGLCSLNEGVDRLTLSVVMDIDNEGNVTSEDICEGVIRSSHRMTYKNVAAILDGDESLRSKYADVVPMLENMEKLADLLTYKRKKRGSIEFELSESRIVLDENGRAVDVTRYPIYKSNKMIEEFMLAANETVAERFARMKIPFVFRTHETPSQDKLQALLNFLSAVGVTFRGDVLKPVPADFADLLSSCGEKLSAVINRVTLRSMMKAAYEPENKGHFGLAAKYYCHFTSPIRRYADLAIHRIIKDWLKNGESGLKRYAQFAIDASKRSSEREKIAESAERDVDDLKKAEFMSDKIGKEYDGVISGVTEWGVFVELENSVEGLVRIGSLPDGNYVYNRDLIRLDSGSHSYCLGDKMRVRVYSVDGSKISFRL
ncbi:MAG: ribonuclease R [Clostridia bacterium]|nr:ribonuclease R [Clostridia bacterium]